MIGSLGSSGELFLSGLGDFLGERVSKFFLGETGGKILGSCTGLVILRIGEDLLVAGGEGGSSVTLLSTIQTSMYIVILPRFDGGGL